MKLLSKTVQLFIVATSFLSVSANATAIHCPAPAELKVYAEAITEKNFILTPPNIWTGTLYLPEKRSQ